MKFFDSIRLRLVSSLISRSKWFYEKCRLKNECGKNFLFFLKSQNRGWVLSTSSPFFLETTICSSLCAVIFEFTGSLSTPSGCDISGLSLCSKFPNWMYFCPYNSFGRKSQTISSVRQQTSTCTSLSSILSLNKNNLQKLSINKDRLWILLRKFPGYF